jgi:DNA polymerase-4
VAPIAERRGLTLVGVAVGNLHEGSSVQLALPLGRNDTDALDAALDEVWRRFGPAAVSRAGLLGRRRGLEPPLLPD